jgi:hypothetical protein
MSEGDITDLVSKPSKAEYGVACDVVGCDAYVEIKDDNSAAAAYVAKYGVAPDGWLPDGWRSVRLPIIGSQVLARTARVSEIAGVAKGAFVRKEDHGHYTFTICADPTHGDDPELRGPWDAVAPAAAVRSDEEPE